ncbi:MAG: glycosyltransferase [Promethearchaeota archaeon]
MKMIKVLIISFKYDKKSPGGAAKSFLNISEGLKKDKEFHVSILFLNAIRNIFNPFGLSLYLKVLKIIRMIKKTKPHVILVQSDLAFPGIIAASIMNVPIINLIRDTHLFCPKNVDIIKYGIACSGLKNRKECYECINYWRSLRILIGNKGDGWQNSRESRLTTIAYKIRYIICKINIFLCNRATINLIASNLMKSYLSLSIKSEKLMVANITPIKEIDFNIQKIEKKNNILFIIPKFDASYKGLDFVLRLSKYIPEKYHILIVGNLLKIKELKDNKKIINIEKVSTNILNELYQTSLVTLAPSFCNDAFGRVIIESLLNNTPVIAAPNCGAVHELKNSNFLRIVPININLWIKEIVDIIKNQVQIPEKERIIIFNQYSIENSLLGLKTIINDLLNK